MGIREYIEKGQKLKEIIEMFQSTSEEEKKSYMERDEFNKLLLKHGLNPIPIDNDTNEDGDQKASASCSNARPSENNKPLQVILQEMVKDYELPVIANPFEDLAPSIFDIEVYQNFFAAVFLDGWGFHIFTLSEKEDLIKYIFDGGKVFVGYNIFHYDNPVLKYIHENENLSEKDIFDFSQRIIQGDNQYFRMLLKEPAIDLFAMKFKRYQLKLKEVAVRLGCMNIQCLPYPSDTMLNDEQKIEVIRYCINDILITAQAWERAQEDIELRKRIGNDYGIDVLSDGEGMICEKLFRHLYQQKTGSSLPWKIERGDEDVKVSDLIPSWISFKSPDLSKLPEDFKSIESPACELRNIQKEIEFCGKVYRLGSGGIHSTDEAGIFTASEESAIFDLDAASYYPSIILRSKLYPDHLGSEWTEILRELTQKRLGAKHARDKIISDTLKIVINGANGKTWDERSFMYDPKVYYSVVLTGQFGLLMLIEALGQDGVEILSANTDGVIASFERRKIDMFDRVCQTWEATTRFELEKTEAIKYIRKDINDYILIKTDGAIKARGIFEEPSLSRKADAPIVSKALRDYFISNRPVEETIRSGKNILDFAYSFSAKKGFSIFANHEELSSTVRWYVCNNGVTLEKRKEGKTIKISNASRAKIINHLSSTEVPDDIDFEHYIQEAKKIILQIENTQKDFK